MILKVRHSGKETLDKYFDETLEPGQWAERPGSKVKDILLKV